MPQAVTPILSQAPRATADGSAQYPFRPFSGNSGKFARNTDALLGYNERLTSDTEPATSADLAGNGSRFVIGPMDPTSLAAFKFMLADASANNKSAYFVVRGYKEQVVGTVKRFTGSVLMKGYVIAGNGDVGAGNEAIAEATTNSEEAKYADTIEVEEDYTLGENAQVIHAAADGSATLVFDFDSNVLLEIEFSLDGTPGGATPATGVAGFWTQM